MALLESGEMYLESILILSEQNNAVRSIDVAEQMICPFADSCDFKQDKERGP